MPNHVTNVIKLNGDRKRIRELLEQIQNDELGLGTTDFNKIIPIPENIDDKWYDWCIVISDWICWNRIGIDVLISIK